MDYFSTVLVKSMVKGKDIKEVFLSTPPTNLMGFIYLYFYTAFFIL